MRTDNCHHGEETGPYEEAGAQGATSGPRPVEPPTKGAAKDGGGRTKPKSSGLKLAGEVVLALLLGAAAFAVFSASAGTPGLFSGLL